MEHAVHWSVQHRRAVLIVTLLLVVVMVPGVFRLQVHNRMTEWVDPAAPDAAAFLTGVEELDGLVNFERTLLGYAGSDPDGLLSVGALRDQEALVDFVAAAIPELSSVVGPVRFVQLAQYEIERGLGEDPQEARLPESDDELRIAIKAARDTQPELFQYVLTPDLRTGYLGFQFESPPFTLEATAVGGRIADAIQDAYRTERFSALSPEHTEAVGVASVSNHVNGIMYRDMAVLGALGVGLVFVLFLVSAGRPAAVLGGFTSLGVGLIFTMGTLGWLGIPFNVLNFAVLPLVMGNGIDYSIHVLAEARADRRGFGRGLGRHLGKALGVPIVLVTLTTCIGLLTLGTSRSPYLRQMGVLAASSIALIAVLSLTYLPACLAAVARGGDREKHRPAPTLGSGVFLASGRAARKNPLLVAAVALLLSGGGLVAFATMDYEVDLLSGSLPKDDALIAAQREFEAAFDTEDSWFLLMQGQVVSNESFAFQERFLAEVTARGFLQGANESFNLPAIVEGHRQQRALPGGGVLLPVLPTDPTQLPEPESAEEGVAALEAEKPYREITTALLSRDHSVGALYMLPLPEGEGVEATDQARAAYQAAVVAASPPEDLDVRVYSYKLLARDFMAESQQSLTVLYVVSLISTLVLFFGVTNDWRATAVVALPVLLSSLWWFGLLKLTLGSIGVYQLISLVFITSIGSDYAAYLVYKYRDTGDWAGTLRITGRAVLFSALTDAGAFLVFSMTRVRSGGQMLLGAALAVTAIFAATWLVVPGLLRWLRVRQANHQVAAPDPAS